MSPLHCACWKGQTDAVRFLLLNGAQIADVDVTLKSALHWTVQFSYYDTMMVLFQHGGSSLLNLTDKNDQTALHYAAFTGEVSILKYLLEAGAKPDSKDQEERSSLHIAAQNDKVSCVEALIQASNHETNDDDLDGRTPLLLASLSGHQQAVQTLILLGSDVSRRDDEHGTALMLAAAGGHASVMRTLIENHASVNEVDKMKNTALHYACHGGHVEAVQLLLDRKADVKLKNTHASTPLDLAIDNLHQDVVNTILGNKSICQECMSVRDKHGKTPLDRLIAKLPDSVLLMLDHCVERTSRDDEEKTLTLNFDYQFIDPGPDDPSSSKNRYFALNTMVLYERDVLLSHHLCQNILSQKWVTFGRRMFYVNLFTYIGYLTCLTTFVALEFPDALDVPNGCPMYFNASISNNTMKLDHDITEERYEMRERWREGQQSDSDKAHERGYNVYVLSTLIYIFVAIFFLRDVVKILSQKWKYFFNIYNMIVWILMATTIIFVTGAGGVDKQRCLPQWRAGWIAMFLAWLNFIMYLRRIDFLGIYVIMFVTVLASVIKLILVFIMFCAAFAGSFYIVLGNVPLFNDLTTLPISIVVMTLGEVDFREGIMNRSLTPFDADAKILILIFLFLMPLVLMNLMIGVAVGDIEKIQRNAYLKRIGLQVDLMYNIENNMPKFLQRRVHVKRATIKPNEGRSSVTQQMMWYLIGSSKKVQFIEDEEKDQTISKMEYLSEKISSQQNSLKQLHQTLHQTQHLIHMIANRLDIAIPPTYSVPPTALTTYQPPPIPHLTLTTLPNPSQDVSTPTIVGLEAGDPDHFIGGIDRRRNRSVRPNTNVLTLYERRKSGT